MTAESTPSDRSENQSGGRSLLKTAASALLGLAGVGVLGDAASASGQQKRVVVVGDGTREHTYEIGMESGGTIQKAAHAGGNDTHYSTPNPRVEGELWHWNADSYVYTGNIDYVAADGAVSFHFPDQAFGNNNLTLVATGQGSGSHTYTISSISADLQFIGPTAEDNDTDEDSANDTSSTPDRVVGHLQGTGSDSVSVHYDAVQNIQIDGKVEIT